MSAHRRQNPFEKKVEAMEKGFQNFPIPNVQFTLRRQTLTAAQVVQQLQAIVETIRLLGEAEVRYHAAQKAYAKAMPRDHAFYEELVAVVRSHFGSDPRTMATFGLRAHHEPHPTQPAVVIVEDVLPATVRPTRPPRGSRR